MTLLEKLKAQIGPVSNDTVAPTELSRNYMEQIAGAGGPTGFDSFHQDAGPGGGGGFWKEIVIVYPKPQ